MATTVLEDDLVEDYDRFVIRRDQAARKAGVMGSVFVEIRAGEGGDDAKSLVREQVAIYAKAARRSGL